ncbi:MAG: STAS domain-containing protein [Okeania sp. SIO3H1]|uniref:STAS domain-containing protein n=1 Tax=Okeania sp. SIO1I7 TaxID=2607772 RepID=UPI0013C5796A|nr:STAS domain-containing protein [Okeania sp. SIO1I7]NEN90144.1 STAS domain-containing protein [Okeania sp. SIO3H1]NET25651.1 STAS domain-containing protein [Okeania sp. SIO1I7]
MKAIDVSQHTIVIPNHRLDLAGANAIKQEFVSLLEKKYNLWIIDMANVEFIDSSGLSALVIGLKKAREHGYSLAICNLNPTVRLVFEITQLDRVFQIFDTIDDIFLDSHKKLLTA